jgi:hypothetical protein
MPNAFVSLVLVVLCATAYMHFFHPWDNLPLSPAAAPHPSAPSPTPPSASEANAAAEANAAVQSFIDQKVKEAGGPQYVTELKLVSASASCVKPENRVL